SRGRERRAFHTASCCRSARFSSANSRCVRTADRSVPRTIQRHLTMTGELAEQSAECKLIAPDEFLGGTSDAGTITAAGVADTPVDRYEQPPRGRVISTISSPRPRDKNVFAVVSFNRLKHSLLLQPADLIRRVASERPEHLLGVLPKQRRR